MDSKTMLAEKATQAASNAQLADLGANVVYLMGLSFILGSFFTILVLLLLDFMKRDRMPGGR